MLFNSAAFLAFFTAVFIVYRGLAATARQRLYVLVVANLVFYGSFGWKFVPLLCGVALVAWGGGMLIAGEARPARKRALLIAALALNVVVLGLYKFVGQCTGPLQSAVASSNEFLLGGVIIPVGISFYTFQAMSYLIDLHRGDVALCSDPLHLLAGISLFPHLPAGPILRPSTLLPQFDRLIDLDGAATRRAFLLIGTGLFKKTIADMLAPICDQAFSDGAHLSIAHGWAGALAFAGQIYGDFSGYSDMALGFAALLGFVLPENFALPYLATTPADFWRRWHISLSTWFRDYLYIPLGGNRRHVMRNVLITFLLIGLWHGVAWTFVTWGLFHGALVALSQRIPNKQSRWLRCLGWVVTFYCVTLGWVLFRAPTLASALHYLGNLHGIAAGVEPWPAHELTVIALTVIAIITCHLASSLTKENSMLFNRPRLAWSAALGLTVFSMSFGVSSKAFIYFQF